MGDYNDEGVPKEPQYTEEPAPKGSTKDGNEQQNDHAPSVQSKELVTTILDFLSTSSNEAQLGVLAGLMVATYIILGRVGLLLIGTVLGIILHASWEGTGDSHTVDGLGNRKSNKRRELSLEVANRLLDWRKQKSTEAGAQDETEETAIEQVLTNDFDPSIFRPETATALKSLTDAVIRDYVNYWYTPILPLESTFPLSCRKVLTGFITSVSSRLARKRPADTFLEFLVNSSSITIVFLNELSAAFQATDQSMQPEENVKRYLELFPESSLANVLAKQEQHKKIHMASDDFLSSFLDKKAYEFSPVRNFLREILAGVVFESTITSLSRPEFINSWIIHLCSEGGSEIMSAIDAGVEGAQSQGVGMTKGQDGLDSTASTSLNKTRPDTQEPQSGDKATEEAILETKRLSLMIASQDSQNQSPQPDVKGEPETTFAGTTNPTTSSSPGTAEDSETSGVHRTDTSSEPRPSITSESRHSTSSPRGSSESPPLTLLGASVMVDDGSEPGDKGLIRSKPTANYLIQIEPVSSRSTGWMIFRKYTDFESLHPTLETISRLNNVRNFSQQHPVLPSWKGQTKQALARNLESYLQDALNHEPLAESEKMKRFLEKDGPIGSAGGGSAKSGFSFPSPSGFENMGKGVLDALTNAPKGVADGGKAVLGGVTGVFGGANSNKRSTIAVTGDQHLRGSSQTSPFLRGTPSEETQRTRSATLDISPNANGNQTPGRQSSSFETDSNRQDYPMGVGISSPMDAREEPPMQPEINAGPPESSVAEKNMAEENSSSPNPGNQIKTEENQHKESVGSNATPKESNPLTNDETQIAVELIFAVINELYTLSSAWNFRRTLLNAAKSYILRPGSPNLETIRSLLQESMIEAHTSDESIGYYITKLRENALPTKEELDAWPPSPSDAEKQRLKETARKLFVQRGLPQALTSVMGAAASREALEKIFDSLQVDIVARGLVTSVLLQAMRAVVL